MSTRVSFHWNLRQVMAENGIFQTTDLVAPLVEQTVEAVHHLFHTGPRCHDLARAGEKEPKFLRHCQLHSLCHLVLQAIANRVGSGYPTGTCLRGPLGREGHTFVQDHHLWSVGFGVGNRSL